LILASLETGVNPLSFSSGLTKIAYEAFAPTSWLINLATFTGQAVCLFTIVRPRLAMWTTVFFDLMHAGIFVFTGIFFWKYILLNLAIVFGLKKMLNRKVPNLFALVLILLVIISPFLFHITFFYWLDSPAMNSVRIFAFDKAGREYRVPASNFLSMSVTFVQHRLIHPHSGPFPTWTWGTTLLLHEMYDGQRCTLEQITPDMPKNKYFVPKEIITRAIQKYHLFMMANIDENGYWAYDLYPHHIFSVPWAFKEYRQLDKREIVGYKYSIEAVCLGYENSTFTREVIWRGGFDIELVQ